MKKQGRELLRDLGWHGVAGVMLLAGGLAFSGMVLEPAEEHVALARNADQKRDAPQSAGKGPSALVLERLYDFIGTREELTDQLAGIYSAAQANGLQLKRGDYKLTQSRGGGVMQYQISLPLTGDYNQIRRFTAQVLDEIPAVTLDRISFERKNWNEAWIEAQITFTLYRGRL